MVVSGTGFFVRVLVSVVCVGSAAGILFLLGTARYGTGGQMLLVISEQGTQTVISIWSLVREEILGMLLYIVFLTAAVLLISFNCKNENERIDDMCSFLYDRDCSNDSLRWNR